MDEVPPRIHDLHRLTTLSGIFDESDDEQLDLLDKLSPILYKLKRDILNIRVRLLPR